MCRCNHNQKGWSPANDEIGHALDKMDPKVNMISIELNFRKKSPPSFESATPRSLACGGPSAVFENRTYSSVLEVKFTRDQIQKTAGGLHFMASTIGTAVAEEAKFQSQCLLLT